MNVNLFIGNCKTAMKSVRAELEGAKQMLGQLDGEPLSIKQLQSLITKNVLLSSDHDGLVKRFKRGITMEGTEEICVEIKALCTEIKTTLIQILEILNAYDLSSEDFKNFLFKNKFSNREKND